MGIPSIELIESELHGGKYVIRLPDLDKDLKTLSSVSGDLRRCQKCGLSLGQFTKSAQGKRASGLCRSVSLEIMA